MADFFASLHQGDEIVSTELAVGYLRSSAWARSLLERQHAVDLWSMERSWRFEVRFAKEIAKANIEAEYEYRAGVGASSVDFRLKGEPEWLIEIVSIEVSDAARRVSGEVDGMYYYSLTSEAADKRSTEEGETVRASEKISEKAHKFPTPSGGRYHLIVADMRGFLIDGGDFHDYRHIAFGPRAVPPECVRFWSGHPIAGLFEETNPLKKAAAVRERIHFVGFVSEEDYADGELRDPRVVYYVANPTLLSNDEAAAAFTTYPLRPRPGSTTA
jgi:hypothetical protein